MSASNEPELAALTEMTEAIANRMVAVERDERAVARRGVRSRSRRGLTLALAGLLVGVPAAAAVTAVFAPSEIPFQAPSRDPETGQISVGDDVSYVVAEGTTGSRSWTVAVKKCQKDQRVGLGIVALIGTAPRTGGMAIGACPGPDASNVKALRAPAPGTTRSLGLSLLYGVVPAIASDVAVRLQAAPVGDDGFRGPGTTRTLELKTDPLTPGAVKDGELSEGYRVFHAESSTEDLQILDVTATDSSGATVLKCSASACETPGR